MKRAIVTGSSGFIGAALVRALALSGWDVLEMRRRCPADGRKWLPFDLREGTLPALPAADLVIHAAYDFSVSDWASIYAFNVQRSIELFVKARDAGCRRFIYISSMAAFPGCRSLYGRAKFEVERKLLGTGALVVRPGFVIGPGARGMAQTIANISARMPVIPLIGLGRQEISPCHIDDLCRALIILGRSDRQASRPLLMASKEAVSFAQLIRYLSCKPAGRALLLPVPAAMVRLPLLLAERLGFHLPLRSDSVVSLTHQNPAPLDGVERFDDIPFQALG